jgi:hypothetical protein
MHLATLVRVKHYADTRRSDFKLKQGQEVLLSTKFLTLKIPGENKLLPKYVGPFKVLTVLSDVSYKLDLPDCMKCHPVFHVSLLKAYRKDGRYQPPPLPFEFDEDEGLWYQVDAVLKHRILTRGRSRTLQYLVSFTGYDAAHNQWCDAEGVTQAAIDEYHTRTNTTPPVTTPLLVQVDTTPTPAQNIPRYTRSGRRTKPSRRART